MNPPSQSADLIDLIPARGAKDETHQRAANGADPKDRPGAHTFVFVTADGVSTFVNFHANLKMSLQSVVRAEAMESNFADAGRHRRDLSDAIDRGDFPEWGPGVQLFDKATVCPQNVCPEHDFTDDPLLQGRNFWDLDTQFERLGGPNLTMVPVDAPKGCPVSNRQQDLVRFAVAKNMALRSFS